MSPILVASVLTLAVSSPAPYPDQLDILRAGDTTPQVVLLLDTSCSMAEDAAASGCSHYVTAQTTLRGSYRSGGTWYLSRLDQLKAALTGCRSASDGILDQWASRVAFAVREFGGSRTGLLSPFDPTLSNRADLESAVMRLPANGGTPLAPAYREAARYFDSFFHDGNTARCRQNYIVVMSDGVGNSSGGVRFDFVAGQPNLTVRDANFCFGNVSPGCPSPPYLDAAAAYLFEDSNRQPVDVLTRVTGTQPIRTYTVGFQAPTQADALLQAMAARGDGQSFSATSYDQLSAAFQEIISTVVARSRVAFAVGSVETEGLFSGNHLYVSMFRPVEDGHWIGTTKKHCILPEGGATGCLFIPDPTGVTDYLPNPRPVDVWTGSTQSEADAGGSGQVMLSTVFGVADAESPPPSDPLARRSLWTWRPGSHGYVRVHADSMSPTDTWTAGACAHHALLNALHGFTEEVRDCGAGDMAPVAFDRWPIGDTAHGGTVLLQYTRSCERAGDRCFAVTVANDGMLHVYDAVTGRETSAVIPGELWRPGTIAHHVLRDRGDQPAADAQRRYYFDGRLELFHEDLDGDGVIDSNEKTKLIAGLGRAGRAYYLFDVRTLADGVLSDTANPPRPLFADEATGFRHLRDTWAAPWTGGMEVAPDEVRSVAVFPSGHLPELDAPTAPFAELPPGPGRASPDGADAPHEVSCADLGIPDALCATPDPATFCPSLGLTCASGNCTPCTSADQAVCQAGGRAPAYCYDWPGLAALPASAGVWGRYPLDVRGGPYRLSGSQAAIAYRVRFARFDLQPGDQMVFFDGDGREVGRMAGSLSPGSRSPWVPDDAFSFRLVTNGVDDASALGYAIEAVEVIRGPAPAPSDDVHRPSLFVVDLDRWSSATPLAPPFAPSEAPLFAAPPVGEDARQAGALLARLTSVCDGSIGPEERCVDALTAPETSDLRHMVCPISAEPAVYTEGGVLRAVYVGDECGQIWAAKRALDGTWSARRLLRLNAAGPGGATVAGRASKDYRKIFRRLDVVISTCPGRRAVGLYFGTGNLQRPAARDALEDPTVSGAASSDGRDVVGVVWDSPDLTPGAGLADLADVTDVRAIADPTRPEYRNGWYIRLVEDERMLRDPLVFDGVAYFDVYRPIVPAQECSSATGESRTLVVDNCTAAPIGVVDTSAPVDEQRTSARRTDSTIGGGLLILTPFGLEPIITLGYEAREQASLPRRPDRRSLRLYMWRP